MNVYSCNGKNIFMRWKMECSIQPTSYPGSFFGKDPGSGWSRGSHILGAKLKLYYG